MKTMGCSLCHGIVCVCIAHVVLKMNELWFAKLANVLVTVHEFS